MKPVEKINIDGFEIGGDQTFVIAEIGSNHNQSLPFAFESIDAAKESGANAVKFQSLNLKELYYDPSDKIIALHKKIDLEESWHLELKNYCDKKRITFFSSPTYLKSVDILESVNVSLYKLASAQIGTFPQIIEKVALTGKPVIMSTGLVSYGELESVVNIFNRSGNNKYIILHCNSIYPTPFDMVALDLMETYSKMFGCITGFSDHTDGIAVALAAVSLGAKVIEKHFVLDKNIPSPDAASSIEPKEFKELVSGIRAVEKSTKKNFRTEIYPEEQSFKDIILYRLILKENKKKGEIVTKDDFNYLRSAKGIDCRMENTLSGKKYAKDILKGTLLENKDIE